MSTITVSELKKYFEDRISELEQKRQDGKAEHTDPRYPMIVFFFGKDNTSAIYDVAMHLRDFWPAYCNELLFFGVKEGRAGIEYTEPIFGDEMQYISIESEEIQKKISGLFGERSPFEDKSRLYVYNVIETTAFNDEEDFKRSIELKEESQRKLIDESVSVVDMLILLLNEQMGKNIQVAKKIKVVLGDMVFRSLPGNETGDQKSPTLIISNKRDDNITMESWNSCYKAISDTIALTNNYDNSLTRTMYNNDRKKVFTLAYACEEKPVDMIAQTVIKRLIDRLASETFGNLDAFQQKDRTGLYERLEINNDSSFELLNIYAEERFFGLLPGPEQLQLFPRGEIIRYENMEEWSENEFNNYTMNGWNCYMDSFLKQIKEDTLKESSEKFKSLYLERIANNFSITEWIWIGEHIDEIRKKVENICEPVGTKPVLEEAKDRIKYVIAKYTDLKKILTEALIDRAKEATELLMEWKNFSKSVMNTHDVKDETINRFYGRKIQDFFDTHNKEISDKFHDISNMDMLRKCIYEMIKMIIESDDVFYASFEKELELRLQEEGSPAKLKEHNTIKKLSNLPVFYSSNFRLHDPFFSGVLVKTDTPLYEELKTNLPEAVFYDTGNSNYVEALEYIEIESHEL